MALLELSGVTKRFGGLIAVNEVSLSLEEGRILGVIGPNGSGKTTMFAAVSGFHRPEQGRILFQGQDIVGRRPSEINALGLARTFQIVQPFPELTVAENVLVGALRGGRSTLAEARERAAEVLEFTRLDRIGQHQAGSLTIADRKRLEVARAIATEPKLLLLDEVMAGLRPKEIDEAVAMILKIRERGVSIIVVEHLIRAVLALAEQLAVIHHGRIIAEGEPREVIDRPEVVEAYFGKAARHA